MKNINTDIFTKCGVKFDINNLEHVSIAEEYYKLNLKIKFLIFKLTVSEASYGYVSHPKMYKRDERHLENMKNNNPVVYQYLMDYEKAYHRESDLKNKVRLLKESK